MPPFSPHPKRKHKARPKRTIDERHLGLVRQLQCLACGAEPAEAAHIRYGDLLRGKPITGIGIRPDDKWTVPLCPRCHRLGPDSQHGCGERSWWEAHRIDPLDVAARLYELSARGRNEGLADGQNLQAMRTLIRRARRLS